MRLTISRGGACARARTGTGKSVLLREIISRLKLKWKIRPEAVAVTAATGIAACHVGGTTLHSWAGIGIGIEPVEKLCVPVSSPAASRVCAHTG